MRYVAAMVRGCRDSSLQQTLTMPGTSSSRQCTCMLPLLTPHVSAALSCEILGSLAAFSKTPGARAASLMLSLSLARSLTQSQPSCLSSHACRQLQV